MKDARVLATVNFYFSVIRLEIIVNRMVGVLPDGEMDRQERFYFNGGMPRSLQIFRARMSLTSEWRGTADLVFFSGLQRQWLPAC